MNNLNYNLEIIGEKENYTPNKQILEPILSSEKKIFEITADNSYGKTFILNLIAYALSAEKLDGDRILSTLKDSIARYDDNDAYSLDYSIDIELPDKKKLSLTKEKGRSKLIQINNGAPISYNQLHKDLSIIYDVPTNPSERLNAVIKDLGVWNENLLEKFIKISRYLNDVTKEFDSVRNEDKIHEYKKKWDEKKEEISGISEELKSNEELLKELTKLVNLKQLKSYLKTKQETQKVELKQKKAFKLLKKPQKIEKKDELKVQNLTRQLAEKELVFKNLISKLISHIQSDNELSEFIKDDKVNGKHYDSIKEKNLKQIISSSNYILDQKKFMESIDYIKSQVLNFINEKKNSKTYIINNIYKELIAVLENLIENDIDHLFKTATSVDTSKIKTQIESIIKEHKIKNYDSIRVFFKNELNPLKGYFAQYFRDYNAYVKETNKKLVNNTDSKYYEVQAKLKETQIKLKQVKSNFDITMGVCARDLNINDTSRFDSLEKITDLEYNIKKKCSFDDEKQTSSAYKSEIENRITKLEERIINFEKEERIFKLTYEKENKKNQSKYNDNQKKKIEKFFRIIRTIITNTSNFKRLISNIENGDLNKFKDSEDIQFIEIAGKIIAYSMDNKLLRKDGEFVDLKFYDMKKQEFHCSGDLIIKKEDVSTGLASANYLKQRIENVEGKYVVVLLDEIGNMAQNALNKVIESIRKLDTQNRLVLAMFTRPNSNGIKIIEY